MEEKYKDEILSEVERMNNELYQKTREEVTKGHRLPYKDYIRLRSLHWVKVLATPEELAEVQNAIRARNS